MAHRTDGHLIARRLKRRKRFPFAVWELSKIGVSRSKPTKYLYAALCREKELSAIRVRSSACCVKPTIKYKHSAPNVYGPALVNGVSHAFIGDGFWIDVVPSGLCDLVEIRTGIQCISPFVTLPHGIKNHLGYGKLLHLIRVLYIRIEWIHLAGVKFPPVFLHDAI